MDIIKDFKDIQVNTDEVLEEDEQLFMKVCMFLATKDVPHSFVYEDDNVNALMVFFRRKI